MDADSLLFQDARLTTQGATQATYRIDSRLSGFPHHGSGYRTGILTGSTFRSQVRKAFAAIDPGGGDFRKGSNFPILG